MLKLPQGRAHQSDVKSRNAGTMPKFPGLCVGYFSAANIADPQHIFGLFWFSARGGTRLNRRKVALDRGSNAQHIADKQKRNKLRNSYCISHAPEDEIAILLL